MPVCLSFSLLLSTTCPSLSFSLAGLRLKHPCPTSDPHPQPQPHLPLDFAYCKFSHVHILDFKIPEKDLKSNVGPVSTETHRMSVLGRGQGTARPQVANWWLVVGVFLQIHFLWLIQCWPTPCLNFFEFVSGIVKSDGLWFESTGNGPALGCASPLTTVRKRQPPSPPRPEHVLSPLLSGSSFLDPLKQTVPITHHLFSPI